MQALIIAAAAVGTLAAALQKGTTIMSQENKLVLNLAEINDPKEEAMLRDAVCTLCGVECVTVNAARRSLSIIGADLPREDIIERIEEMGFTVI